MNTQIPIALELPKKIIQEAIVNAVVHKDCNDNRSVQVKLFSDRLEILNSEGLPPPLTMESLRTEHLSLPRYPLLAESRYLQTYFEKTGTGTLDMIRRCIYAEFREPDSEVDNCFLTRIWRCTDPDG